MDQKFSFKCMQSSGIRVNDAVKIDAVLKDMKYAVKTSVTEKAQNETRRYLEYVIDF